MVERHGVAPGNKKALAAGVALRALGDAHHGQILDAEIGQDAEGGAQLSGAAIDQYEIGPQPSILLGVLFQCPGEAALEHFGKHGVVVPRRDVRRLYVEFAIGVLDEAVRSGDDHGADRLRSLDMAVVVDLDALRRPLQIEGIGQLFHELPLRGAFGQAARQRLVRIGQGVFHELALGAAPRHGQVDLVLGPVRQRRCDQVLLFRRVAQQDRAGRDLVGIELPEKRGQNGADGEVPVVAREIGAVAVMPAGAEKEYLDTRLAAGLMGGDDVGVVEFRNVDVLARLDLRQGPGSDPGRPPPTRTPARRSLLACGRRGGSGSPGCGPFKKSRV